MPTNGIISKRERKEPESEASRLRGSKSHLFALQAHEWAMETTSGPDKGWELAHSPVPKAMGDETILLPHNLHQWQGLLQSEDIGRRCFWTSDASRWLYRSGEWPTGWFDLCDLLSKWAVTPETQKMRGAAGGKAANEAKNAKGQSLHALRIGKAGGEAAHRIKLPNGRSLTSERVAEVSRKMWRVTHPDGHTEVLCGLSDFCRTHGLIQGKMTLVAQGKRNHHKGFTITYI